MDQAIENLLLWATNQGIELDGIEPKVLPGRGIGIVATRDLEANETILTVPISAIRSYGNTPKPIVRKLKGAHVHAILAASLCLDESDDLAPWRAVFPSKKDLMTSMPVAWPVELQDLLPAGAQALLKKQKIKFEKDWKLVSAAYPNVTKDDYLYSWLLIDTRTFYHVTRATAKLHKDNHMILQPVADLFNHNALGDSHCAVAYDTQAFTVTTRPGSPAIRAGDEVFIRYGAHPGDLLLVEYGFAPPPSQNPWDEVVLDSYVCPLFEEGPEQGRRRRRRALLEDAGFWGGYKLDARTECYRTQTALRLLRVSEEQWRAVVDGERDEDEDKELVDEELAKVLRRCEKEARARMAEAERSKAGEQAMRDALRGRWAHVKELVVAAQARLEQT